MSADPESGPEVDVPPVGNMVREGHVWTPDGPMPDPPTGDVAAQYLYFILAELRRTNAILNEAVARLPKPGGGLLGTLIGSRP